MMSQKVIDILNRDEKAIEFKKEFERHMDIEGFNEEERQDKRQFMMMLCINNNDEAKEVFSSELYEDLRAQ